MGWGLRDRGQTTICAKYILGPDIYIIEYRNDAEFETRPSPDSHLLPDYIHGMDPRAATQICLTLAISSKEKKNCLARLVLICENTKWAGQLSPVRPVETLFGVHDWLCLFFSLLSRTNKKE